MKQHKDGKHDAANPGNVITTNSNIQESTNHNSPNSVNNNPHARTIPDDTDGNIPNIIDNVTTTHF